MSKHTFYSWLFGIAGCLVLICVTCIIGLLFYTYVINVDTEYASGYSDSAFEMVEKGMTSNAVLKLLGGPLEVHKTSTAENEPAMLWIYAKQGKDKRANFNYRIIRFYMDGNVYEPYSVFEID